MKLISTHIFEISAKAISDMVRIFGPDTLSHGGRFINILFSPEEKRAINVEYICQPICKLTFQFKGDGYVDIYDNGMNRIASCSVYDSYGQTARERVQQMVMDAFDRRIFLD